VAGTCRRKALRAWEASCVGACEVERALAPFGEPGAVRVSWEARQEASEATCSRLAYDSTGRRESRSGKPSTLRGRAGMVSARGMTPIVLLLEAGEPLAASQRCRGKLCVVTCTKVWERGRRAGSGGRSRREPGVREPRDPAGADDNKLVAEIGERHLAAGRARSAEPSSDGEG
jgi:hypothetical protein